MRGEKWREGEGGEGEEGRRGGETVMEGGEEGGER